VSIEPDTKDWTWVLERPCTECGFDASAVGPATIPDLIEHDARAWEIVLRTDDAACRPEPHVWSPLEYACHIRDVHRIFLERLTMMMLHDDPEFADWDQDAAAVNADYGSQDPLVVAGGLLDAALAVAEGYRAVGAEQWGRTGRRSNGSRFTVDTLVRYHLHDVVHHAHDVAYVTKRLTVAAYDSFAADYANGTQEMSPQVRAAIEAFAADVGPGAHVLEIGTGSGRDAALLEELGVRVRRTDISPGFVRLLHERGIEAEVLDPLTDDLSASEGDYDGVYAHASLLHVRRADLPIVTANLAAVTRSGGIFRLAVKEGEGARFSIHGSVGAPRLFTFWREGPLRKVLGETGWEVTAAESAAGLRGETWLEVTAVRR
jgi:SAM-dependent methyltransferase